MVEIIISIIKRIYVKTGIEEKIKDSMVESNIITRLLGLIVSPLLMVTLMFNVILVFLAPNFNLEILNNIYGCKNEEDLEILKIHFYSSFKR